MCYEATIASAGGDDATLKKSLIITLEGATTNWYSRFLPRCIYSWQQLKEKILLNFQRFQAELTTEEDFMSCTQYEKKTDVTQFLSNVYAVKSLSSRSI
jgi:hypothetical protein